jgi:hypothetical protein
VSNLKRRIKKAEEHKLCADREISYNSVWKANKLVPPFYFILALLFYFIMSIFAELLTKNFIFYMGYCIKHFNLFGCIGG